MKRRHELAQLVVTLLVAVPLAFGALGQTPDELAQSIQRDIEDIVIQIQIAPTGAEQELARQKGQVAVLRNEAPDHPLLPSLERRIEELDAEIVAALEARPEGAEQFVPLHAPAEVRRKLRQVETLQTRADREMMSGAADNAAESLRESQSLIEAIEAEYGDRIPPGYAALIIAKERAAALQDQLDQAQQD
jgi:hypothetical protein